MGAYIYMGHTYIYMARASRVAWFLLADESEQCSPAPSLKDQWPSTTWLGLWLGLGLGLGLEEGRVHMLLRGRHRGRHVVAR